ncbi:MAG: zf-TFIIB domain-containing protein [Sandaracinus sp.]
MQCPQDQASLAPITLGVVTIERCPTCRGVWASREALEAVTGRPLATRGAHLALGAGHDDHDLACPCCTDRLDVLETRDPPIVEVRACRACARLWVTDDALASIKASAKEREERRSRTSLHRPALEQGEPTPSAPRASARPEGEPAEASGGTPSHVVEHPFYAPGPARELAILTGMLALAWLFAWSHFGEAIAILARIQFHELGHALVAWSTGRSALPLPFGWTSWSYERSNVLVAMEWLFTVLLAIHGVREKKPLAIGVALGMAAVFALGLLTPLEQSERWLVAGGITGEALLPAIALLAFHVPRGPGSLPERARWDFFRWLLALFAVIALASVVQHDLAIADGTRPLPMGSFVSSQQGDGDLERLVHDHGWAQSELRPTFGLLGHAALALTLIHPIVFLVRWLREGRLSSRP